MFAFDHISYAGYIKYHQIYLNTLLRKDNSIVKDLIINGHGESCSGDSFSIIHGDFVNEHFKKKRKELLGLSHQLKVLSFTYAINKWIKTSHIHILQFGHDRSLKANLKRYNANIFGDGPTRNLTTGRGINKEVIDGFLHAQKTLETNSSGLLSRVG